MLTPGATLAGHWSSIPAVLSTAGCWATIGAFNLANHLVKLSYELALIIRDESIALRL